MKLKVDLLIKNINQLINPANDFMVRGSQMCSLRLAKNIWLASIGEEIVFLGKEEDFLQNYTTDSSTKEIAGEHFVVLPGFIDPHTHLPFGGTRQDEFQLKLQGVSYQEIARQGGGIKKTVRQTREISLADLIDLCSQRVQEMLLQGTTTIEAKSGYGLNKESEIKQLEALRAVRQIQPIDIVTTFMGAHDIPEEFSNRNQQYLDYLLNEVAPEIKAKGLAEFCDIFCEDGYFTYEESRNYMKKMHQLGFKLKMHADEFTSNQAAALAAELQCFSCEHLIAITAEEINRLAASRTCAILLPGVSFFLKLNKYAPARELIAQDAIVALGTDFNPGSSMISSQLFIFWLAIFELGMTLEEAINAVTINAAYSIDRSATCGSLIPGKKMDLLLLEIPDYQYLAYHPGRNPVHSVIKSGEIVVSNYQLNS